MLFDIDKAERIIKQNFTAIVNCAIWIALGCGAFLHFNQFTEAPKIYAEFIFYVLVGFTIGCFISWSYRKIKRHLATINHRGNFTFRAYPEAELIFNHLIDQPEYGDWVKVDNSSMGMYENLAKLDFLVILNGKLEYDGLHWYVKLNPWTIKRFSKQK